MLVTYKPGNIHTNTDFFSRLKQQGKGMYVVNLVGEDFEHLTDDEIISCIQSQATEEDTS